MPRVIPKRRFCAAIRFRNDAADMFDGIAKALLGTIGTGVEELFFLFVS